MPRPLPSRTVALLILALLAGPAACARSAQPARRPFPGRVLLTNDNGIEDRGLVELARAFARVPGIEVVVVAPREDRSGASNVLEATRAGRYRVERRVLGPGIEAWAVDGTPADCVVFALSGVLRDRLPDLVVSGINGGANLGDDWFGSGTIGAARTAAYFGIPAVAVSGVDDDAAAALAAATSWVVRFVRGELVASLRAPRYLTVSLPSGGAAGPGTGGARIVGRARGLIDARAARVGGDDSAAEWRLQVVTHPERAPASSDVATVAAGAIAIVPMRADEVDDLEVRRLQRQSGTIPAWAPVRDGQGRTMRPPRRRPPGP